MGLSVLIPGLEDRGTHKIWRELSVTERRFKWEVRKFLSNEAM